MSQLPRRASLSALATVLVAGAAGVAGVPGAGAPGAAAATARPAATAPAAPVYADFDGDGFSDLAVGAPYEDLGGVRDAGSVTILYGGASGGVGTARRGYFTQADPDVPGAAERGDHFGAALVAGDLDGDGFADLA